MSTDTSHEKAAGGSKSFWNAAFSLFEPEMKKFAERLAATIPDDSPLRNEGVSRAIAVVKSLLESRADGLPGPFAAALETATDGADFFSAYLTGTEHGGDTHNEQAWMDAFFGHAGKRLAKATDPTTEATKLEEEFFLRIALLDMIKAERAKQTAAAPHHTPAPPIDFAAQWAKVKAGVAMTDTAIGEAVRNITAWIDGKPTTGTPELGETLPAIGGLLVALWNKGSFILRTTIILILGWPMLVALMGMLTAHHSTDPRLWNGLVAMIPIIAVMMSILTFLNPAIFVIIAAVPGGWAAMTYLAAILLIEVLFGVYLSIVPTWNDTSMIPAIVMLGMVASVFWMLPLPGSRKIAGVLGLILLVITGIFFLGGTDKVAKTFEDPPPRMITVVTLVCEAPDVQYVWNIRDDGGGKLIIPVLGKCSTPLVLVPIGQGFKVCPKGNVERQAEFTNEEKDEFFVDKPGVQHEEKRLFRGIRFRNTGEYNGNSSVEVLIARNCN